ncbi:sulfite exporter TauE/SafE family protein [Biformimicrobium ophioploci]|uniref:Probable membrane transporter protein n=1 Tax=Biformimicrobium ophioploci TaxID=3036711 RepID=A0ABQ6LUR7_9GAMM|nr:sulfite exporter TauE/SafE family protein [Microbulbifer sp. NKW57]GMG85833.1 sulfite exporter TauE/SafE family protein [Microbulbifer sp. NKW57]
MDLTTTQILLAASAVALGALVQSLVGFGQALVAAPLLFLVHPQLVPGPILASSLVVAMLNTWYNRSGLRFRELGAAIIGMVPGSIVGALLLKLLPQQALSIFFAGTILLAVAISISHLHITPTRNKMFAAGCVAGIMGTTSAINGPPMALMLQHEQAGRLRANLAGFFTAANIVGLTTLSSSGLMQAEHWQAGGYMALGGIIGFTAAYKLRGHFRPEWLRPALLFLCSMAACVVLLRAFSA